MSVHHVASHAGHRRWKCENEKMETGFNRSFTILFFLAAISAKGWNIGYVTPAVVRKIADPPTAPVRFTRHPLNRHCYYGVLRV